MARRGRLVGDHDRGPHPAAADAERSRRKQFYVQGKWHADVGQCRRKHAEFPEFNGCEYCATTKSEWGFGGNRTDDGSQAAVMNGLLLAGLYDKSSSLHGVC